MSIAITPIITNAGLGVFIPAATGIEFTFTHVAVGTGTSAASAANTALENEIARFPIAGGGINTDGKSASINALIVNHTNANPQNYDISEFGFYGLNSVGATVLFMIYRQNTRIINKVSGVDIAIPFSLALSSLPANNITVQLDTNISAMLALLGQHTSSSHPHTQYKRYSDSSQVCKVANGVDDKDAVNVEQLEAVVGMVNSSLGGANHTVFSGSGNNFVVEANSSVRIVLIGGGAGGGGSGSGGGGYGNVGAVGDDSIIYPQGNPAGFLLKAKGGLGGDGAYGGNGSSYAIGGSPKGQEVDINNLYDVVILSYQNGLDGTYGADTPLIKAPIVKKLNLTQSGRGGRSYSDGYYAIAGAGSGGAFVEALIINRINLPLTLTIDCGLGGVGGTGLNLDGTVINGQDGEDGICVVISN